MRDVTCKVSVSVLVAVVADGVKSQNEASIAKEP